MTHRLAPPGSLFFSPSSRKIVTSCLLAGNSPFNQTSWLSWIKRASVERWGNSTTASRTTQSNLAYYWFYTESEHIVLLGFILHLLIQTSSSGSDLQRYVRHRARYRSSGSFFQHTSSIFMPMEIAHVGSRTLRL